MGELTKDKTTGDYHYSQLTNLFKQRSNVTTCNGSDELPAHTLPDQDERERRQKLLHTRGVVGSVKFVHDPARHDDNPYTGLFQGAEHGIVRLSETGFLLDGMDRFSPSMALKFEVDWARSENLLGQVNFDGIEDDWFFAENFTNHPPRSENKCMRETVEKKFAEASRFPFSIGTSAFAQINQDGTIVADEDSEFPFELVYVPNRDAFKRNQQGQNFLEYFESWEAPTGADGQPDYPVLFTV